MTRGEIIDTLEEIRKFYCYCYMNAATCSEAGKKYDRYIHAVEAAIEALAKDGE